MEFFYKPKFYSYIILKKENKLNFKLNFFYLLFFIISLKKQISKISENLIRVFYSIFYCLLFNKGVRDGFDRAVILLLTPPSPKPHKIVLNKC